MVSSKAKTVAAYLKELPADRRAAIAAVRKTILKNLPQGYKEVMQYGMISYIVPFSVYPDTYNGMPLAIVSLASQKNAMSLHLVGLYVQPKLQEWFVDAYKKTGKRLDMGKGCVRFRKLENLPLDVVGKAVAKVPMKSFIAMMEKIHKKKR